MLGAIAAGAPMLQSGINVKLPVAAATCLDAARTITIKLTYRRDQIVYLGDSFRFRVPERIRQGGRTREKQVYLAEQGIEYRT
jgi:hypothetical protein